MTETDELRRLLDERDVKYQKLNEHVTWVFLEDRVITFFSDELGVSAEVSYPKPVLNGTKFLTPDQAIAATLGNSRVKPPCDGGYCPLCGAIGRTCHIVKNSRKYVLSDGREVFEDGCSICNGYLSEDDNYCSSCGARRVE